MPTSQFLGTTDGIISFGIFANAELENNLPDGSPVGTSSALSKLNSIIELINMNAVSYRRYSKNDSIYIKHPMARLLRYKKYDENDLQYVDIDENGNEVVSFFNLDDYLSCTISGSESSTVPGLPYCSRFNFTLVENYRSSSSNLGQVNLGLSNKVYESTKKIVQKLADKYRIQKEGLVFKILNLNNSSDPDFSIAQKLIVMLNDALLLKDFATVGEALLDRDIVEKRRRDVKKEIETKFAGSLIRDFETRGIRSSRSLNPLSSDGLNEIVSDILILVSRLGESDNLVTYEKDLDDFKSLNLTVNESNYPDMLLPSPAMQSDFFIFNESDQSNNQIKREILGRVHKRYEETAKQFGENIGNRDAALKISPDLMGSYGPICAATNIVTLGSNKERKEEAETDKGFSQAPLDQAQQFSNIQTAVDNFTDNTYTIRRSMPTFKLYIKDGDVSSLGDLDKDRITRLSGSGIWRNFTDFYDINGIIDIRLVKDKNNPADILVIRMTNTREDLINKTFEDNTSFLEGQVKSLKQTRPGDLDSVMLREGTRIELRLGYDSNPNLLSTEFSGRISQIGGGDIAEIVCQGDGIELIQEIKGIGTGSDLGEKFTWSSDTANIISEILHDSPEVTNFGTINAISSVGELPFMWRIAGGRTVVENIFVPSLFNSWSNFRGKTLDYALTAGATAGVLTGGVLAPPVAAIAGAIGFISDIIDVTSAFFKGAPFTIYEQTIWEVLQELTFRHPGTICQVVPYDDRSTIFFGYPDQLYFHKGPRFFEALQLQDDPGRKGLVVEKNRQQILMAKGGGLNLINATDKGQIRKAIKDSEDRKQKQVELFNSFNLGISGQLEYESNDAEKLITPKEVKTGEIYLGMMKQFRNYHMITSEHDIIENGLTANSDGVFNSIQVVHPKRSSEASFDGTVGFSAYEKTDEIRADDDLNKEYIKRQTLVFHNAHKDLSGLDLPEKYAVSNLCNSLNNVYKGKIKILGRPGIKPYDIVFVYDSYNNIYGPVEVASIIQIFSYDTGWITEIIPHMIVSPTTSTSLIQINAIQRLTHSFYLKNSKLFYSGFIFNDAGEIKNDVDKDSDLLTSIAIEGTKSSFKGAAFGYSGLIAERAVVDGYSKINAAKKLTAAKDISKIGLASKGAKFLLGRMLGSSLPILGSLGVDYLAGYYASWSKFRQPIVFLPVTRNGKPWYTALYGLNNNTEIDAIKAQGKDIINKGGYFIDFFKEEFPEVFD